MNSTHSNDDSRTSPLAEGAAYFALSEIALADRPIDETLDEVVALAKRVLPETPETSVTLLTNDEAWTAAFSGELANSLDERQYDDGYGPCLDAAVSGGAIQVTVEDPDGPYPDFRQLAHQLGVSHSLSVGLPAAGRTIGALNLYTTAGQAFSDDSSRIAGTFAGFAGIALATVGRYDDAVAAATQLQQALQSRAVISQAQGILMSEHHYSRNEAFAALLRLAQQEGMKLQAVAQELVDRTATS